MHKKKSSYTQHTDRMLFTFEISYKNAQISIVKSYFILRYLNDYIDYKTKRVGNCEDKYPFIDLVLRA